MSREHGYTASWETISRRIWRSSRRQRESVRRTRAKAGAADLMMTCGLKNTKTKAVIAGPRASMRAEATPVFHFYFDDSNRETGLKIGTFPSLFGHE
jgi:hypothetical protein